MKLFVSTPILNPKHSDFNWTENGELLDFGLTCCNRESCGCDRSLIGLNTRKGTTLALVSNVNIGEIQLADMILDSWARGGWTDSAQMKRLGMKASTYRDAKRKADDLILSAMPFEIGDLVERAGHVLAKRQLTPFNPALII